MLEKLVHHVIGLPEENLPFVFLEDIALCAAFYDSLGEMSERRAPYDKLRGLLDLWVHVAKPLVEETMGRRQQPMLRKQIELIQAGKWDEISRADADFVYFAAALARRCSDRTLVDRPLSCLVEHLEAVAKHRAGLARDPGLAGIESRANLVFAGDLRSAPSRDVRVFAGLAMPYRGPVLVLKGDTKVFGPVPEDTMLVVEEGDCYVQDRVLGRLAVRSTAEVQSSVAGVVVARRGDVNTGKILNPGVVISKEGTVRCWATEKPKMVFGCRELTIACEARMGLHLGRCVEVGKEVAGGTFHVSERIRAPRFCQTDDAPLRIILRRGLTCQDYGEDLTDEARILLLTGIKLRQQLDNYESLLELTERESDEYAGNVLLFLLGSEDASDRYLKVQKQRRRIAYMDRLLGGMETLIRASEDRLTLFSKDDADSEDEQGQDRNWLEDMQMELTNLSKEGSMDTDLALERDAIIQIGRRLRRRGTTERAMLALVEQLSEQCGRMADQRQKLASEVEAEESAIQNALGRASLLNRAKEDCTRREMLDQLLAAARKRPRSDAVNQRANDHYVRFMRRLIETRESHLARYEMLIDAAERRIRDIKDRLWEEFMVSLPYHVLVGWAGEGVHATGCFDEGIPLLAWPHLLEEFSPKDPGVCMTAGDPAEASTYIRSIAGHIERR